MGRLASACAVGLVIQLAACTSVDTDTGVEWINSYTYPPEQGSCNFDNLGGRDDVAIGFYDVLTSHGYTGRFQWGDGNAWANDFMDSGVEPSGDDHHWIDTVDFAYHADHGNVGIFGFGRPVDRCIVAAEDCRWGDDDDLEWIVLDDCSCLRQGEYGVWWPTFQGLHMIVSFDTNAHDASSRGRLFAEKLVDGWSVRQAWWYACEQTEGDGTFAAIAGACNGDTSIYDEHIWKFGHVAGDPVPLAWWWWTHHDC